MVDQFWVTPHSSATSNHTFTSNTPAIGRSIHGFQTLPPTPPLKILTLMMATEISAEIENLQQLMQLIPESQSYTVCFGA
jgi:hypothetical protein